MRVPVNKSPRMPRKLKVGPHTVNVLTDTARLEAAQEELGKSLFAFCDHNNMEIHIWPGLPASVARQTLIHELLHLIYPGEVHSLFGNPGETEEFLVENLSGKLLSLLRENPQLTKWLLS